MNTKVLLAVFKRNFVSYFASPLGYVFICVFVLLSTIAAFWTNEFFNANLANLDQLNAWFPFIMLVFIPAITMGVWAEERRQGTDELLLTIPAGDLEIVLGKYAAAVAIYSVSLLFSLVCTLTVLARLGSPDIGLFLATYVGYWLVGLAMLSIGMVASFLTSNLTVAFILGALFNAPLVFAVHADTILSREAVMAVKPWSFGEQFREFGRGILSFSGLVYFLMIAAMMLYLSMILIARRHWVRGRDWLVQAAHYAARVLALAAIVVGANVVFHRHDLRADLTTEKLSSLAPKTVELLSGLELKQPVQVEAFISPTVPEGYVQTQLNLRSMLEELQALGGDSVQVQINKTEKASKEAARAEKRFGITPRRIFATSRGAMIEDEIFMGVAFTCGLQKVTLPFVDRGTPIEYELVRAILSVSQQAKRKKVGILQTDAQLFGRMSFEDMSQGGDWWIVDELRKSYEVVQVDAAQPITEKYDVLVAVQPSSLGPEQMGHFMDAVRGGQPTAIFEDPLPFFADYVPGTAAPKRPPGGNPFMMNPAMGQKGDIGPLWRLLGVNFSGMEEGGAASGFGGPSKDCEIIYQEHNPYPKLAGLPDEFVFVDNACGAKEPFNRADPITEGLQHVLFPMPGFVSRLNASTLDFTPLVRTGDKTGTVKCSEAVSPLAFMMRGPRLNDKRKKVSTESPYVLAAEIRGEVPAPQFMADEGNKEEGRKGAAPAAAKPARPEGGQVHVVLVTDIDFLTPTFFRIREQGDIPEERIHFDFDNVTFALNIVDRLAGEDRFFEIRGRRPAHRTLTRIDRVTQESRTKKSKEINQWQKRVEEVRQEEEKKLNEEVANLREQLKQKKITGLDALQRVEMVQREGQQRKDAKVAQEQETVAKKVKQIESDLSAEVRSVQDRYKFWAVALPPIPPFAVAIVFFVVRRAKEREGVARSRLRS